MQTRYLVTLSDDKFQEIYTDKEFRNSVANAHILQSSQGEFLYKKTCSYPTEYKVTDEQINLAQTERERDKKELLKEYKNKLVFIGMGMRREPLYDDDVANYRIRTYFRNKHGRNFFIEFGTGADGVTSRVDHAIDVDLQNRSDSNVQNYNNYKGLERQNEIKVKYTKQNILNAVNHAFDCCFKEIVIDNFTLSPQDIICISPL